MPPPVKFKCKLLTPDADKDGDGQRDGQGICPFHHSSNGRGIKNIQKSCSLYVFYILATVLHSLRDDSK